MAVTLNVGTGTHALKVQAKVNTSAITTNGGVAISNALYGMGSLVVESDAVYTAHVLHIDCVTDVSHGFGGQRKGSAMSEGARVTDIDAIIENVEVTAYEIPTDGPDGKESDGTYEWSSTTVVIVEIGGGGKTGLGYTYGPVAIANLIDHTLKERITGRHISAIGELWRLQMSLLRNMGVPGVGSMAVSAVDVALWDLKAKLLGVPLFRLLGAFHDGVPVYGSGGFCNYPLDRLADQLVGWVEQGIPRVKVKTSRDPSADPVRLGTCRRAIGDGPILMTDANGALSRKEGLYWAHSFHKEWGVTWMEEPVASVDRQGLRLLRDQGPPGLDIAAGEYGYVLRDFADLLEAGAVDCLQADVTRCGGITGLLQVAGLCAAHNIDLSAHCAPSISAHAFCAVDRLRHLEYFHDHVRIEHLFFDGALVPKLGVLFPSREAHGLGLTLKRSDAEPYRIHA